MASPHQRWVRNLNGDREPLIMKGLFDAGATTAIMTGQLLEHTGTSNTVWVPMDSDFQGAANVAVAACDIKSGDRAGYYPIIVPRPGDVFEYPLAAASAIALGASVYYSTSEVVAASGSYVLGYVCGMDHYPQFQEFLSDGNVGDHGVTVRSTAYVQFVFALAVSYWSLVNK